MNQNHQSLSASIVDDFPHATLQFAARVDPPLEFNRPSAVDTLSMYEHRVCYQLSKLVRPELKHFIETQIPLSEIRSPPCVPGPVVTTVGIPSVQPRPLLLSFFKDVAQGPIPGLGEARSEFVARDAHLAQLEPSCMSHCFLSTKQATGPAFPASASTASFDPHASGRWPYDALFQIASAASESLGTEPEPCDIGRSYLAHAPIPGFHIPSAVSGSIADVHASNDGLGLAPTPLVMASLAPLEAPEEASSVRPPSPLSDERAADPIGQRTRKNVDGSMMRGRKKNRTTLPPKYKLRGVACDSCRSRRKACSAVDNPFPDRPCEYVIVVTAFVLR
jgi:hypothetical protein